MTEKDKKSIELGTHLSFACSAAGAVIGASGLVGPEHSTVGGIIGASLGGSLSFVLGRKAQSYLPSKVNLSLNNLIRQKLKKDFLLSTVHEHYLLNEVRNNAHSRIIALEESKNRDFTTLTPDQPFKWLGNNINNIKQDLISNSYNPKSEKFIKSIELVNNLQEPLQISCECIESAAVATLLSMKDRYMINIEIDYEDTSGVYQVMKASDKKDFFDFIITASAPFFLFGNTQKNMNKYRLDFEIHGEEQVILSRKSWKISKNRKLHVFGDSSAEEQYILEKSKYENTSPQKHVFFEELQAVVNELNPGESVIAWEPLASVLSRSPWVKKENSSFTNWISLFCHERWTKDSLSKEHEAFRYLFIYEWLRCKNEQESAVQLLLKEPYFMERFSLGAGLTSSVGSSILSQFHHVS